MQELITASPSLGALRCQPMSIAEIDAHPDADRIWATIKSMRDITEGSIEEAFLDGQREADRDVDNATAEAREECADDLRDAIDALTDADITEIMAALEVMADKWSMA